MKKICIVTGTRAEYGLLKPVIEKVHNSDSLELQLVVTGMHLSPEFGLTYQEIERDGYPITSKIEMLLSSDTSVGITKSMAVALMGFAECFENNKPDMVVILGDRYEMLMVATAAMIARIPISHIHGGELTEGLIDEAIRHSITKMSFLHFTATEEYRRRVIQLGEQPERVFNIGALGVENIKTISLLAKEELENAVGFKLKRKMIMVTYHPVTLDNLSAKQQFSNILCALDEYKDYFIIFTKANSDTDGRIINHMIDEYVHVNSDRSIAFTSLGQLRYLSILPFCSFVLGNSSSGLIEVPSFKIPTINIGDRQRGRVCSDTVCSCGSSLEEIKTAIDTVTSEEWKRRVAVSDNPYEGKNTSQQIVNIMEDVLNRGIDIKKMFYDMSVE